MNSKFYINITSTHLVLPDPYLPLSSGSPDTCLARFRHNVRCHPGRCAISGAGSHWTYGELDRYSDRIATLLRAHGVMPGDFVAIYASRSIHLPLAMLGILKAGAAFVVLDSSYRPEVLRHRLELARPAAWIKLEAAGEFPEELVAFRLSRPIRCSITLPENRRALEQGPLREVLQDSPEVPSLKPVFEPAPDSIAYMAFTSGSTRSARGVIGTHGALGHFLEWHCDTFGLNSQDRFAMLAGLSHDPLLRDIFTALWLGATLAVPDPEQVGIGPRLLPWLVQQQITVIHLTPALGDLLVHSRTGQEDAVAGSLRYAFFGGETLTSQTVTSLCRLAPDATCVNFYGATETPQAMGYHIVDMVELSRSPGTTQIPIGQGIRDVQLLILTEDGDLADVGEAGEIFVRTPFLTLGYVNEPELTAERFLPDRFGDDPAVRLYRTGDWGRYLLDGAVEYLGRRDDQIKLRGFRIQLGDIEAALRQHTDVRGAIVIARGTTAEDQELIAYVASVAPVEPLRGELMRSLASQMPAHMMPAHMVVMERLPLTPNGKIDRHALPAPEFNTPRASYCRVVQPSLSGDNELEEQLIRIWQEALRISDLTATDDFFDIGGNSIRATLLLTKVEKEIGISLSLRALIEAPTVRAMVALVRSEQRARQPRTGPILLQPEGSLPPLFCAPAGGGGSPFVYHALAAHIGSDQPLYALEPFGIDGSAPPHESIRKMAEHHVAEIRSLQRHGPYYLCGLSLGGNIAYEMARQLQNMGERIGLLVMFDTQAYPKREPRISRYHRLRFRVGLHLENLRVYASTSERLAYLQRMARNAQNRPPQVADTETANGTVRLKEAIARVEEAQDIAGDNYRPAPYAGDVVLLRATTPRPWLPFDPALGWTPFIQGRLTVIPTPGTHFSLLNEPCVQTTVAHLHRFLTASQQLELTVEKIRTEQRRQRAA